MKQNNPKYSTIKQMECDKALKSKRYPAGPGTADAARTSREKAAEFNPSRAGHMRTTPPYVSVDERGSETSWVRGGGWGGRLPATDDPASVRPSVRHSVCRRCRCA